MDELEKALAGLLARQPHTLVLSAPRSAPGPAGAVRENAPHSAARRRVTLRRVAAGWQAETLTATQAFHHNLGEDELPAYLAGQLMQHFTQLSAQAPGRQLALKVSKKGRVLTTSKAVGTKPGEAPAQADPAAEKAAPPPAGHDRQKHHPLPEGVAIPPLVDLGVLTRDGRPVAAMRDKYRQINRFVELVEDALRGWQAGPLRVVDFGCGKSYLTFVLYYYLKELRGFKPEITGLDLRADVVDTCNAAALKYGYEGLRFAVGNIADAKLDGGVDLVVTLHACDTATDQALAKAVGWGARAILSVPCCQHELNGQMRSEALAILTRYGLIKERTAALYTDAIRANLLGACGYKTQLVEFIGFEHTPKNIMIRAVKAGAPRAHRQKLLAEVTRLCAAFGLKPTLLELLQAQGALPDNTALGL